ncbi:tautomerase family protein [Micromonospora zamorensis]|uniref:tautomerase family protein n=1 Tax=Micromonospora zamorensis TaxID=709883 RepID=UPI003D8C430E
MPIVTIQITREGSTPGASAATAEEKAALIKGVSEVLRDVLNKPLTSTFVVIDEVETENWGWGGLPVEQFRQQVPDQAEAVRPDGGSSAWPM